MDAKLRVALSPVALATLVTLAAGAQSVLPVPWLSAGAAYANHCAPPCDCDCVCVCVCDCDIGASE